MEVICANALCAVPFRFKGGPAHHARAKEHYCSRSCQNTTHGLAGTPEHRIWERTRKRAKENGVIFSLTVHDIPPIPTTCPVLRIGIKANTKSGPLDSSPSIDRLNPRLGYAAGNIRIISNRANRLRSDATALELRQIADDALTLEASLGHL
jgi:hypothetical protein